MTFFRRYTDQKYQRWLSVVDTLHLARNDKATAKEIGSLVTAERFAYGQLKTAIGCVRDEVGSSSVPLPVAETIKPEQK